MLRKLAAGTGAALVAAGLAAAPAMATRLPTTPDESCGDVPHAEQNGLVKVTDPADGSTVTSGETINVTLKWSESLLAGAVLDRALDCVEVDGVPAPGLSLDQPGVANQSPIVHRYRIPSGLAPGARVCDQGFLFGPPADVPQRLASNRVCFTVAPPVSPPTTRPGGPTGPESTPPTTRPSAPPEGSGPGGPGLPPSGGSGPGGPGSPGPGLPPGGGGRVPSADTSVTVPPALTPPAAPAPPAAFTAPAASVRAPAGAPEEATPALPSTGRDDRPLTAAGGGSLFAAGLALIGGARHRRRQRLSRPAPPR